MTMEQLLLLLIVLPAPALAGALLLHRRLLREERLVSRLALIHLREARPPMRVRRSPFSFALARLVGALGTAITESGLLSRRTIFELRETLISAGLRADAALGLFVGSKILLVTCLPFIAWVAAGQMGVSSFVRIFAIAACAVGGLLLPDFTVRRVRQHHLNLVERGLPDALDMMVICAEAGLALEPAIGRVAQEIAFAHPAVAEELALTASELRILSDAHAPLANLGKRTGLESLRRLGTSMVQSLQYGTPLAQALRTLAGELRQEMLTRFEERAARLPVLLTVPMVLFILPALFIVVGGPAAINVLAVMHH